MISPVEMQRSLLLVLVLLVWLQQRYWVRSDVLFWKLNQIGGRVATQTIAPNLYWDEGAHWIHDTGSEAYRWQQLASFQKTASHGPHLLINSIGKQNADGFGRKIEDIFKTYLFMNPMSLWNGTFPRIILFFATVFRRQAAEILMRCHGMSTL